MDALILAAGRGSRLGSHTDDRPKSLIDLGGISPLEFQIDLLAERRIARAVIVVGYRRHEIEATARARAGSRMEVVPVWNPFWPISNVIGSVWLAQGHLRDDFVYLHADTVFEPSILDDLLASNAPAALPIDLRPGEPEQMKARVSGGRVMELSKALPPESTAGEFIGIGVFRATALEAIRTGVDAVMAEGRTSEYFEAALNHAIAGGLDVRVVPTAGRAWTEIDFEEDLRLAKAILPRLQDPSRLR